MWPNMRYRDFSNDIKRKNYFFQRKHAGRRKNGRK